MLPGTPHPPQQINTILIVLNPAGGETNTVGLLTNSHLTAELPILLLNKQIYWKEERSQKLRS